MIRHPPRVTLPPAQLLAQRVFSTLERFLHVEAVSGVVLLLVAAVALIWANSPAAESYHQLWHAPITLAIGGYALTQPLHFVINDVLMTIFFLVVGMEIRREMHEGVLSDLRVAVLPLVAAMGGVAVPALIYVTLNPEPPLIAGWAVPTATDIAFAVGVLALLGRSIPGAVRILLLALAIIDDIAAVIIIAMFYSSGIELSGLLIAGAGVLLVLGMQHIGVGSALPYVVPGAIIWTGFLKAGVHPTLAGVVLGLMTPVRAVRMREQPLDIATRALTHIAERSQHRSGQHRELAGPLRQLRTAQRELLPPVVRAQMALHPWVAYGVMPLFALANAGVSLDGIDLGAADSQSVLAAVTIALVFGKPIGICLGSWLAVRLGPCQLPQSVTWHGMWLMGCLGGIGFTMSIFIANLAFSDDRLLAAAKAGVLLASVLAGVLGLLLGRRYIRHLRATREGGLEPSSP